MHSMLELNSIHAPVAEYLARQLDQVSLIFERQLASDHSAINGLCMHIELYRGKMLRPTLVLLTGMAASDDPMAEHVLTEKHRVVAAVVGDQVVKKSRLCPTSRQIRWYAAYCPVRPDCHDRD